MGADGLDDWCKMKGQSPWTPRGERSHKSTGRAHRGKRGGVHGTFRLQQLQRIHQVSNSERPDILRFGVHGGDVGHLGQARESGQAGGGRAQSVKWQFPEESAPEASGFYTREYFERTWSLECAGQSCGKAKCLDCAVHMVCERSAHLKCDGGRSRWQQLVWRK